MGGSNIPPIMLAQTPSDIATLANVDQAQNPPPVGPTQDLPAEQGGPGAAAPQFPSSAPNVKYQSPTMPLPPTRDVNEPMPAGSWGSRVYHGVLAALGGSTSTAITAYDPTTGKAIVSNEKLQPGQQWKNIIAGAMAGLSAGAQVRGPGTAVARMGAGYQAGQQQAQQRQEQSQKLSQQEFENMQKAAHNNAETSMLAAQTARSTWDLGNDKVKASVEDMQRESEFSKMISTGGAGTTYLGQFKSFAEANQAFQAQRSLHHELAMGQLGLSPHINENGMVDGVQAAIVTPQWLDDRTSEDHVVRQPRWDDEKKQTVYDTMTVPAGGMTNRDWMQSMMSQSKESMVAHHDELEAANIRAETRVRLAEIPLKGTENEEAQARIADIQADTALKNAKANATATGADDWGPGGYAKYQQWYMKEVTPVQQTENSYQVAKTAYDEYKALQAKGLRYPTGAESMQLLSKHMQTTFGTVKGGRMTQAMIEEHLHARGITDNMVQAVQNIINGDQLSPGQWDAFYNMIQDTRNQQWQGLYTEAVNLERPTAHVPIPNDLRSRWGLPQQDIPGVNNKPPAAAPGTAPPAAPGTQPQQPATQPKTQPKTPGAPQPQPPNATYAKYANNGKQRIGSNDGGKTWFDVVTGKAM